MTQVRAEGFGVAGERLPQLDGLRAVAVTSVMAFHFIPAVDRIAPLGSIGVRLFFVLSGFLITRILLPSTRIQSAVDGPNTRSAQGLWAALRTFYIRRALRIFPLFYLVLALAALINIGPVRDTIGWHVSYLTNAYLFNRGAWHGSISHLWSLAVEEQFYLVWPCLVLLLPERRLPAVIAMMIVAAPLSRLAIGGAMSSVLPTSCLDSLGTGALLALPSTRRPMMAAGFLIGVPLLAVSLALRYAGYAGIALEVALDFGVSLSAAWLVGRAATGFGGFAGSVLTARPIAYAGTISYGLYLYHGFMPYVLGRYVDGFVTMSWATRAMLLTTSTIVVASVSWRFFEAPILKLKDQLSCRRSRPTAARSEAAHEAA
jgi:peptidoglycan/LPS O-acetylase OafA/YrhL